jgi:hypothetical protein
MTDKALRGDLVEVLEEIKWKSADRDNMEFSAKITTWQLDKINAALKAAKEALSTPEPSLKGDLVEVIEEVLSLYDAPTFCSKEAAQVVLVALACRGQVMGAIRDFDTLEIVECRRLEDTKHLTLPTVLVLPLEGSE